jgi:LacI family transcriptional regulator
VEVSGGTVAKLATIRDVAALAGVSIATVSNLLNDTKHISPVTRAKVEQALIDLHFIPNSASRIMRGSRNTVIGFIALDAPDPFFVNVARGIEDVAREAGCVLVLGTTDGQVEREKQYVEALASMRVLGAVIAPAYTGGDERHLDRLRLSGAAIVLLGAYESEYVACGISGDDVRGGQLAVEHLISLGHTSIVCVGGPGGERQIKDRFAGAALAMEQAGLDPGSLGRLDAAGVSIAERADVGARIAELPDRPTAIFCASDTLALAAAGTFSRLGIKVPDDIAIVGYNNIDQTALAPVPLSTVALPQYEIGQAAARMLFSEAEPDHVHSHTVFEPELVVRESTVGRT